MTIEIEITLLIQYCNKDLLKACLTASVASVMQLQQNFSLIFTITDRYKYLRLVNQNM